MDRCQGWRLRSPDIRSEKAIRVYTPHGGSLHYPLETLRGAFYGRIERADEQHRFFLFESAFARDTYQRTIGTPSRLVRCVFNGVTKQEFEPVVQAADATDILYVGEFRHIKGADLLIEAVARLRAGGRPLTLTLAGNGKELGAFKAQVQRLAVGEAVRYRPRQGALWLLQRQPAGGSLARGFDALCRDRGGCGGNCDGGSQCRRHPGNIRSPCRCAVCAQRRRRDGGFDPAALQQPAAALRRATSLRERIARRFSQQAMVEGVLAGYRDALALVNLTVPT